MCVLPKIGVVLSPSQRNWGYEIAPPRLKFVSENILNLPARSAAPVYAKSMAESESHRLNFQRPLYLPLPQ